MNKNGATCSKYVDEQTESEDKQIEHTDKMDLDGDVERRKVKLDLESSKKRVSNSKKPYDCEICNVSCNGKKSLDNHCEGQKHKLKQNSPERIKFTCELCAAEFNNQNQFDIHLNSKKHLKECLRISKSNRELTIPDRLITLNIKQRISSSSCDLCKVELNGQIAFDEHKKGKFHFKNYHIAIESGKEISDELKPPTKKNELQSSDQMETDSTNLTIDSSNCSLSDETNKFKFIYKCEVPKKNQLKKIDVHFCSLCDCYLFYTVKDRGDGLVKHVKGKPHQKVFKSLFDLSVDQVDNGDQIHEFKNNEYLFKKFSEIVPTSEEIKLFENLALKTEESLKQISIYLQNNNEKVSFSIVKVGFFGKDLMLKGDKEMDLVLLCSNKPTVTLMKKIKGLLLIAFKNINDECYDVEENVEEAVIIVKTKEDLKIRIRLTSLLFENSDEEMIENGDQILNREKCLDNLFEYKRLKWFQNKIQKHDSPSVKMIIRMLRYLSNNEENWIESNWNKLSCWSFELMYENVFANSQNSLTPAEQFTKIILQFATHLQRKNELRLADPFNNTDVFDNLTDEQRESISSFVAEFSQISYNHFDEILWRVEH